MNHSVSIQLASLCYNLTIKLKVLSITTFSLYLQSCLVVFFHDGGSHDRAAEFIQEMKQKHVSIESPLKLGCYHFRFTLCMTCLEMISFLDWDSKISHGLIFLTLHAILAPNVYFCWTVVAELEYNTVNIHLVGTVFLRIKPVN